MATVRYTTIQGEILTEKRAGVRRLYMPDSLGSTAAHLDNPSGSTTQRIVISGCSGGGKSTLLEEMAKRGYPVQPEPGRQIVREQLASGGDGLPWENPLRFVELCAARSLHFYDTAASQEKPTFFDRSLLDSLTAYRTMGLPAPAFLTDAVQRCRYARRVFLAPPWQELFANDAERRHSFADSEREYAALLETYAAHGHEIILLPKVSVKERADFLEHAFGG